MENEEEPIEAAARTFYEQLRDADIINGSPWEELTSELKMHFLAGAAKAHEAYHRAYDARAHYPFLRERHDTEIG